MNIENVSRETIFALASGQGRAGVAIVRISGEQALSVLSALTQMKLPEHRKASVRKLYDSSGSKIDEALVLSFKCPASFTGEDMVELHIHGGLAIIEALSDVLFSLGLRQAEPGEFTRRAFQNGKMDLTEAEGLADLIDSETQAQRKQALRQMQGGLRENYENWRSQIIDALANIEGEIDFPDEGDVPDALALRAGPGLEGLTNTLRLAISESGRGERVRHGVDIAIIGAPNAGKSSLLNQLAKKEAAIVSSHAGTTRDIVEIHTQISGLAVRFSDTAGLRDTDNEIEAEGVRRARLRAREADIRIAVIDLQNDADMNANIISTLKDGDFIIYNKADLQVNRQVGAKNVSRETFWVSALTGEGLKAFETALKRTISARFSTTELAGLTRIRHVNCAKTALNAVKSARENLSRSPELAASDLQNALHAIKELAGETDIEAVLDRVFSSFCIGK